MQHRMALSLTVAATLMLIRLMLIRRKAAWRYGFVVSELAAGPYRRYWLGSSRVLKAAICVDPVLP
jgi:hypothetical protein